MVDPKLLVVGSIFKYKYGENNKETEIDEIKFIDTKINMFSVKQIASTDLLFRQEREFTTILSSLLAYNLEFIECKDLILYSYLPVISSRFWELVGL
jgi:hypothetical protein